jgi:ribonucleoside-triphosphate reductase (formate)
MHLGVSLDKDFEKVFVDIKHKYPEIIEMEGLSNKQLDPMRFFKTFLKSNNVANASIDDNSNVNSKAMPTLLKESYKPLMKLLSFNKIFIEMKELFSLEVAENYLTKKLLGEIYEHDNFASSFEPYCYYGKENIQIKYRNEEMNVNFEELYNLVEEDEIVIDSDKMVIVKNTNDLLIKDIGNEGDFIWTKILRVMYRPKANKKFIQLKLSNGLSQIVTDNHPVITTEGEKKACDIKIGDKLTTCELITEMGVEELDSEFAWILGMILSDGWYDSKYRVSISQNYKYNQCNFKRIIDFLKNNKINHSIGKENTLININDISFIREITKHIDIIGKKSDSKKLNQNFLKYKQESLMNIISGIIDGDGVVSGYKNRRAFIRMTSRTLLNQISLIIRKQGVSCRDRMAYLYYSEKSFESKKTMFGIEFNLSEMKESGVDIFYSNKVSRLYVEKIRNSGNFKNKRYTDGYGVKEVIDIKTIDSLDTEDYVYDISTETGHFIQNNILSHNCFAYSVKEIYEQGLFFINEMKADRPKHLDTYHSLVIESTAFFTNLQSGAVGLVDVLLYSFKMWKDDIEKGRISIENSEKIKIQEFQKLVYALNQPFLKGQQQSAYTNFSIMDREYFLGLFGGLKFYDGTFAVDYIEEFMEYQKSFLNFVREERVRKSFTFPVITASLIFKEDKFKDEDMAKFVVRHNMTWGDVNIYVSDNADKLSSCCRAQFDTESIKKGKKLEGNFNSIGGTDLNIGSTKVVTLNLPRIAFICNYNFEKVKEKIKENVELIQKFHKAHRNILEKNISRGLLPTYEYGLMSLDKQFATVGVTGMEEYIDLLGGIDVNIIGERKYNEKGINYAKETLQYINELGEVTVEKYGYTQNQEQIPGEAANTKLLKKDRALYQNYPIKKVALSNQWCGLDSNFSLSDKIKVAGILDNLTGGGQIFHANLGEKWANFEDAWNFNLHLAKSGVKYWSEIRKYQYCNNDHNFFGSVCPICGGKAKGNIIKIVGYLTKDEFYTNERKEELNNRVFY